jgi:hypothetical protein
VIFAHVGGVPVEETLAVWLAGGAGGGGVVFARAWLARRRLKRSDATGGEGS